MHLQKSLFNCQSLYAILLSSIILFSSTTSSSKVKTFHDLDDFNRYLSDHSDGHITLVKFFAPWCGHCKHLAPTWQELGVEFYNNPKVTIAQVDCTTHDPICSKHSVRGFPTLTMFMNQKTRPYKGPRKLDNLKNFVVKAMADPVKKTYIQNPNLIQYQLITGNDEFVKNFQEIAGEFFLDDNLEFIYEGHSEVDRLLVSNMGSKDVSFEDLSLKGMRKIVAMESLPLWNDLTASNYANVAMNDFMGPRKLVLTYEESTEQITLLKSIAELRTFQQQLVFGVTDHRVTQYFHIELEKNGAVIFDPKSKNWWKLDMSKSLELIEEELRVISDGYRKEDGGPGGWFSKLKHGFSDLVFNMKEMARQRPIIAILMIGLPLGVIVCFCYAICFMNDTTQDEEVTERLVTQDEQGEVHEFPTDRTKQEREFAAKETENIRSRKNNKNENADEDGKNSD